ELAVHDLAEVFGTLLDVEGASIGAGGLGRADGHPADRDLRVAQGEAGRLGGGVGPRLVESGLEPVDAGCIDLRGGLDALNPLSCLGSLAINQLLAGRALALGEVSKADNRIMHFGGEVE